MRRGTRRWVAGARRCPGRTRSRSRRLRLRPAAGSTRVQAEGRRGRVLPARIDGSRRFRPERRRCSRSEAHPARDEAARARLRTGARRRRRLRHQGSGHRPLVPVDGKGPPVGQAHRHDHGLPVDPTSAVSGLRYTVGRETRAHAGPGRSHRRSLRVLRPGVRRNAVDRDRAGEGTACPRDRADPNRRHRRGRSLRRDPLRVQQHGITPTGVGGEARRLVHGSACPRPAFPLPHRARRRRVTQGARLARCTRARRLRRSDTHTQGPRSARAAIRSHGHQTRRRSRVRRRHILRLAARRARLEAVVRRNRIAPAVGALRCGTAVRGRERLGRGGGARAHRGAREARHRGDGDERERAGLPRTPCRSRSTCRSGSRTSCRG